MLFVIDKIKQLPDFWLFCLTVLLLPLCIGAGVKIASTDTLSFSNGSTQIALGKTLAQSDRLIAEQNEQIGRLTKSIQKTQDVAKKKKVNLPELDRLQNLAEQTEELSEDLVDNNEDLQDFAEEVR